MKKAIGLYLGSARTAFVELKGTLKSPIIASFGHFDLSAEDTREAGAGMSGIAAEKREEHIIRNIRSIVSKTKLSQDTAVITSPSLEDALVRVIKMPTLNKKEFEQSLKYEIRRFIPFRIEDIEFGYEVVNKEKSSLNKTSEVVCGIIKKQSLKSHLSALSYCDITPLAIEPPLFSLIRLLKATGFMRENTTKVILYAENNFALLAIVNNYNFYIARILDLKLSSRSLAQDYLSLISNEASFTTNPREIIVNELKLSVDYFKRRYSQEAQIESVLLLGSGADRDLELSLSKILDVPVETADVGKKFKGASDLPKGFEVPLGLALRGIAPKSEEGINLLPMDARRISGRFLKGIILEVVVSVMLIIVVIGLHNLRFSSLETRLNDLLKSNTMLSLPQEEFDTQIQTQRSALKEKKTFLRSLDLQKQIISQKLAALDTIAGKDSLWLSAIEFSLGSSTQGVGMRPTRGKSLEAIKMVLKGFALRDSADDLSRLTSFVEALKKNADFSQGFDTIELTSAEKIEAKENIALMQFTIECK